MKTTKGIPCNDRNFIGLAAQDRIVWTFATEDSNTPCRCCLRAGDPDPLSGEPVTEDWIKTYHCLRNREVYRNLKADRIPCTKREKALRLEEREVLVRQFTLEYGYEPDRGTVGYLLEERRGSRYTLHLDLADCLDDPCCPLPWTDEKALQAFPDSLPDEVETLREFAAGLTGRLRDVYRLMLEKASGGAGAVMRKDIAEKWHVSPRMIAKDQERLRKMIRKYFESENAALSSMTEYLP